MFLTSKLCRWPLWTLALAGVLGCQQKAEPVDDRAAALDFSKLVPVTGTVTLNGKPLAGAFVTFLPESGGTGISDTDKDGKYTLVYLGHPGVFPGKYKVAISYLLSADGKPQGVGARSALTQSPGMLSAKEQLPPESSDLGRTSLSALVGPKGNTFDFVVKAPEVKPAEEKAAEKTGAQEKAKEEKKE